MIVSSFLPVFFISSFLLCFFNLILQNTNSVNPTYIITTKKT
jgi:hypothetical protein